MHDDKSDLVRYTGDELRDIHRRIDSLKEESERQFNSLTGKLHDLEVTLARGTRFPPAAWVAAFAIVLSVVGTGSVLFAELQQARITSARANLLIETHVQGASGRMEKIETASTAVQEWSKVIPLLQEKMANLETRVVGVGPNGWHRDDHNLYAEKIEAQHDAFDRRLRQVEERLKTR